MTTSQPIKGNAERYMKMGGTRSPMANSVRPLLTPLKAIIWLKTPDPQRMRKSMAVREMVPALFVGRQFRKPPFIKPRHHAPKKAGRRIHHIRDAPLLDRHSLIKLGDRPRPPEPGSSAPLWPVRSPSRWTPTFTTGNDCCLIFRSCTHSFLPPQFILPEQPLLST